MLIVRLLHSKAYGIEVMQYTKGYKLTASEVLCQCSTSSRVFIGFYESLKVPTHQITKTY